MKEKDILCNYEMVGVVLLILGKLDFKLKYIVRDIEEYFIIRIRLVL